MTLKELEIGRSAVVKNVGGEGALRQHFLDMGVIPGAEVTVVKLAPMGDPIELRIHGYELTLRLADAAQITVEPILSGTKSEKGRKKRRRIPVWARKASFIQRAAATPPGRNATDLCAGRQPELRQDHII